MYKKKKKINKNTETSGRVVNNLSDNQAEYETRVFLNFDRREFLENSVCHINFYSNKEQTNTRTPFSFVLVLRGNDCRGTVEKIMNRNGTRERRVASVCISEITETCVTVFDRTKLKLISAVDSLAWKIL